MNKKDKIRREYLNKLVLINTHPSKKDLKSLKLKLKISYTTSSKEEINSLPSKRRRNYLDTSPFGIYRVIEVAYFRGNESLRKKLINMWLESVPENKTVWVFPEEVILLDEQN